MAQPTHLFLFRDFDLADGLEVVGQIATLSNYDLKTLDKQSFLLPGYSRVIGMEFKGFDDNYLRGLDIVHLAGVWTRRDIIATETGFAYAYKLNLPYVSFPRGDLSDWGLLRENNSVRWTGRE